MLLSDFDYTYPLELIAFHPAGKREASRMMTLDRQKTSIFHKNFVDIADFFQAGDVLVMNKSKVFPSRLIGKKPTGGLVEVFLLQEISGPIWECLLKGSARVKRGVAITFAKDFIGEVLDDHGEIRRIRLKHEGSLFTLLDQIGKIPLPPYINREDQPEDRERYQTVYAQVRGSVAAPTAGFHFTDEILNQLKAKGVHLAFVTLHVGAGTFLPIRSEKIKEHTMHGEFFEIPQETASVINQAKKEGRRISVVGTTSVRSLESACDDEGVLRAGKGFSRKFIYPPYTFKVVDRLLTNFHQPKTTLLLLVAAFAGKEFLFKAYGQAICEKYRLFSYGDCMFIS